ncbi:hypothetical protein LXL04_004594 [Taraxacum kok-saghyz]
MAVAGMNNATMLESSYLGENCPPVTRRWGNQERPITRTSYIRKMWRDLEGETRFRDIESQQSSDNIRSQCSCSSEGAASEDASITTSEVENECPRDQNQKNLQNGQEDNGNNSCVQRSPALCLADKQRVRQIFREWGSKNTSGSSGHGHTSSKNNNNANCSRVQGVCENECKRVRTVRQWIESNTPESESSGSIPRLYGRQAYLDLLTRFQMERKQEVQSLLENRPVSTFTHRNRIQSLLKGRFLWNQRFIQEERSLSNAAKELGVLRQTQTVSDIRKGILSRLGSQDGPQYDTSSDNSIDDHPDDVLSQIDDHPDDIISQIDVIDTVNDVSQFQNVDLETNTTDILAQNDDVIDTIIDVSQSHNVDFGTEISENLQANTDQVEERELALIEYVETRNESQEPIVEDDGSEWHPLSDSVSIANEDEWYDNVLEDTTNAITENWYPEDSDDDNGNSRVEIRELMSRRRVSNLLESEFRARLDRLIQSRLEQPNEGSEPDEDDEWMIETEEQNHDLDVDLHLDLDHQSADGNNNENATEAVETQTQQNDSQIIDGLRVDMVNLQERMNEMQKTMETCMNMQLELQKSVKQEVSSALNRSEVRGCFLCCDGGFDSTPDRSGHVYVCSKCAGKIDWSKLKESVKHP